MKTRLLTIMLVALAAVTVSCKKDNTYFKEIPWDEYVKIPPDMAVDMGICNHLKWRSGNLGAAYAHQFGDYYAWGETEYYYQDGDAQKSEGVTWKEGKEKGYDWPSYSKFTSDGGKTFSKYTGDDFTTIQLDDDVARKLLGGKWRIPTDDEWNELLDNKKGEIDREWVTLCGKVGWKFTSKVEGCKGNYIFLPAAGSRYRDRLEDVGTVGSYWSSSHYSPFTFYAYHMWFTIDKIYTSPYYRYRGYSIRPVCD